MKNNFIKLISGILILFSIIGLSSCFVDYGDPAPPLPDFKNQNIKFISAFIYDENECEITGDDRDRVLDYLEKAEPTRIPSENDSVYSEDYRGINIKTEERTHHLFVYKDGNKTYLEIPYIGVYEVDEELFWLLDDYLR